MFKFLVLLALPALTLAQAGGYEHAQEELFNMADTDGNQHVSLTEAESIIGGMDANNDGVVDLTEFTAVLAVNSVFNGHENSLFNAIDIAGDGQLSVADMDLIFSAYDSNGDGEVSKGEWLQPHTTHGQPTDTTP